MKLLSLIVFCLLLAPVLSYGQVVFSETFDEADNSTTGTDNSGAAISWTATCPGALDAFDYFKVLSGQLEARDTNEPPAEWTTGAIDITSCIGFVISMDVEEDGAMDDCSECTGTGVNCVDWIKLEYNVDGGGWTEVAGSTCPATMTSAPGELIYVGDITGGGPETYTSPCIDFGSSLEIRITVLASGPTEFWRLDNITVTCTDCVLPVELDYFNTEQSDNSIELNWRTLSERESDYFSIERSYDGTYFSPIAQVKGQGFSTTPAEYYYTDNAIHPHNLIYYRLVQHDFNGKTEVLETKSVAYESAAVIYYSNDQIFYQLANEPKTNTNLRIYSVSGELLETHSLQQQGTIPWKNRGMFLFEIAELNWYQKISSY